jgi:hypothetical protein
VPEAFAVTDPDRLKRFLKHAVSDAGRQLDEAKEVYLNAQGAAKLPRDEAGRARIVCRRYAERRAVALDDRRRPSCFDPEHQDCQGCLEDIRAECIETWTP